MDKELKELEELVEAMEEAGVIPLDGPEYLYQLIMQQQQRTHKGISNKQSNKQTNKTINKKR